MNRRLATLATGHAAADMCQGAVPTMLPFLIAQRGLSFAGTTTLVVAMTTASSVLQPAFGWISDRRRSTRTLPLALVCGGVGVALAAVVPGLAAMVAAVALSGLGVAAFHPDAARRARAASGDRIATSMSVFSLGGNAGFALAPLLLTPAMLAFGVPGAALILVPVLIAAALLALDGPEPAPVAAAHAAAGPDQWGAFLRLATIAALRSGVYFGLQAFLAAYFIGHLDATEATGNAALTVMLVAGAAGTLSGGRLADRVDRRLVLGGYMLAVPPLLAALLSTDDPVLATVLVALVGFATIGNYSVTVVMGQELLPNRLALASGVTLGFSIGLGGLVAAALGPLADHAGLPTVLWILAALPVPAVALAATLPSRSNRPRQASDLALQQGK